MLYLHQNTGDQQNDVYKIVKYRSYVDQTLTCDFNVEMITWFNDHIQHTMIDGLYNHFHILKSNCERHGGQTVTDNLLKRGVYSVVLKWQRFTVSRSRQFNMNLSKHTRVQRGRETYSLLKLTDNSEENRVPVVLVFVPWGGYRGFKHFCVLQVAKGFKV